MKKSKLLWFLNFSAFAGVWAYVIYKVNDALHDDYISNSVSIPLKKTYDKSIIDSASFSIINNYRDPFLSSESDTKRSKLIKHHPNTLEKSSSTSSGSSQKNLSSVMNIKLLGIIINNETKVAVALISINGKQYKFMKGETIDGIKVLNIKKNAVQYRFRNSQHIIELN